MKVFTAKQIHDEPTPVYQAAIEEPAKISHKNHGEFIMIKVPKGAVVSEMEITNYDIKVNISLSINTAFTKKSFNSSFPNISEASTIDITGKGLREEMINIIDGLPGAFHE